jgi:hypothetical protein
MATVHFSNTACFSLEHEDEEEKEVAEEKEVDKLSMHTQI